MAVDSQRPSLAAFTRSAIPIIKRALRGRVANNDMDDCIQEVLVNVVERWLTIREFPPAARVGYVRAICHGIVANSVRRAARDQVVWARPDDVYDGESGITSHVTADSSVCPYSVARLRAELQSCFDASDVSVGESLMMVCLEGYTEAQTARIQGIPLGTIASRLRRTRVRLRRTFGAE